MSGFRRCQSGAAAIEFAIIALVLVMVCLGVIELGRALFLRNELSFAADFAARKILTDKAEDHEKLSQALLEYENARRLAPHDPWVLEVVGERARYLGFPEIAIPALEQIGRGLEYSLAEAYNEAGDRQGALQGDEADGDAHG